MLATVAVGQLVQVVWVSLLATVVVTLMFAVVVREGARSAEARRAGRGGSSAVHAGLAALFVAAFAASVVVGVVVVLKK
jgi:hypothetical protein